MAQFNASLLQEWKWPLVNSALALLCITFSILLLSGGDKRAHQAFEQGRRIAINMKNAEIIGNPATGFTLEDTDTEKEKTAEAGSDTSEKTITMPPRSISSEGADLPTLEYGPPQPQMNPAMPGNFVGGKLEAQQQENPKEEPQKPKYEYPEAVKQEPQTRRISTAAPANEVNVRDLMEASPAGLPLSPAPAEGLVEKTKEGLELPKISEQGKRPWQVYAKNFKASSSEPLVAVIVTGLGMGNLSTQSALNLQENFTLSFSPYSPEITMWLKHARGSGHEVMLDLPMQTADYPASDPGPYGLLANTTPAENKQRLYWILSRAPGYVGLLAPLSAAVPPAILRGCLSEISSRGLLLAEGPQDGIPIPGSQKKQMGLLNLSADYVIDGELEEGAIRAKLAELAAKAVKNGQAIAIARPYPLTLELLQRWQKELAAQGVRLAPISALAARLK